MSRSAFENYVTTVGTNGTMSFPVLDAASGSLPSLVVGPNFERNTMRLFVKMPDREEALRIPAPLKFDRSTITYEPIMLYIDGPLPPHCTMKFHRMRSNKDKGKLSKKPAHLWDPQDATAIYPANPLKIPTLQPSETLQFEGVSYWYNVRASTRPGPKRNAFTWPPPPQSPPGMKTAFPVSLMLLVKLHWIPKTSKRKSFRVVNGSPIDWASAPSVHEPIDPEGVIDPMSNQGSHEANTEEDPGGSPDFDGQSWAASSRRPKRRQ